MQRTALRAAADAERWATSAGVEHAGDQWQTVQARSIGYERPVRDGQETRPRVCKLR